ncbi:hypothetical protein PV08_08196 [Exophiala spinifera]|uniref:Uncharacterized protein n=1 Tax=Exophiala spinifera TaxID=91928 RepID=A0A0D2BPL5_9EURO|nr:uncharacterized protein PV08_08196 [Exophiala spinifera]KIW13009.1 hypothetical protein PV08_08196 [Exophiala spinifera]
MPEDFDDDFPSDLYWEPSQIEDDQTTSSVSSPPTPSSDISAFVPSWKPCSPRLEMDLSSWDATPEWIKQSSRGRQRAWDCSESDPTGDCIQDKRLRYNYQSADYMPAPIIIESQEPTQEPPKEPDVPLRFVTVTADNILSGDIHRAQGEWKRGRPRLNKPTSKRKAATATCSEQKYPARMRVSHSPSGIGTVVSHASEPHHQSLFQPVFDHLLVTDQERTFFSALFS